MAVISGFPCRMVLLWVGRRRVGNTDLASKGDANSISFNEKSHCDGECVIFGVIYWGLFIMREGGGRIFSDFIIRPYSKNQNLLIFKQTLQQYTIKHGAFYQRKSADGRQMLQFGDDDGQILPEIF